MPLNIVNRDITRIGTDAIVNAANPALLAGGGVCGAIHRAAGPELEKECRRLGGCPTGEARITAGYALPAARVIHTVGPIWQGGDRGEPALLASCYRSSLQLALENGLRSVAFPLISSGIYGYPRDLALDVALEAISAFLLENETEMDVTLCLFPSKERTEREPELERLLGSLFAEKAPSPAFSSVHSRKEKRKETVCFGLLDDLAFQGEATAENGSLNDRLRMLDEGFSDMVLRVSLEKGFSDPEVYKRSNLDRKLFSKVRSAGYQPSKRTALALAIGLQLDLAGTEELLQKAGYALSGSSKADVIVRYFIEKGEHDIHRINAALFEHDQPLLGNY